MGHDPDNRLASQEELQLGCKRFYHKAGCRAGNINLCAEKTARQALINVVVACGDVARMVDCSMALVAIDSLGEIVERMHMKRSQLNLRLIGRKGSDISQ